MYISIYSVRTYAVLYVEACSGDICRLMPHEIAVFKGEKRSLTFVLLKQAQYHLSRPPMPSLTNHYQIVSNHPAFMSVNKQPNNRGNSCAPGGPTKHQPHCSSGQNLGICFSSKNGVKLWPNANKCQTNSIYDWLNRNHVQKLCKLKKCIAGDDIS